MVREIVYFENISYIVTNNPSDPPFLVRWMCLSLAAVQQIVSSNRLQVLSGYTVIDRTGTLGIRGNQTRQDGGALRKSRKNVSRQRVNMSRTYMEHLNQKREKEEILQNHE